MGTTKRGTVPGQTTRVDGVRGAGPGDCTDCCVESGVAIMHWWPDCTGQDLATAPTVVESGVSDETRKPPSASAAATCLKAMAYTVMVYADTAATSSRFSSRRVLGRCSIRTRRGHAGPAKTSNRRQSASRNADHARTCRVADGSGDRNVAASVVMKKSPCTISRRKQTVPLVVDAARAQIHF